MKMKTIVLMAVALGCGLVAMFGVQQVMSGSKQAAQANTVKVLVATQDISPGVKLVENDNVVFKDWPKSALPDGAVTTPEMFEDRAVRMMIPENSPIMVRTLGEEGKIGASLKIPKGMRVVTVPVDTTLNHAGQLLPGDHVDVLATYKVRDPEMGMVSKTSTVLQVIKIFAADSKRDSQQTEGLEIKSKTISLLVTPEEASVLMLAANKGKLHLAIRAPGDITKTEGTGAFETSEGIVSGNPYSAAPEEEANPYEISQPVAPPIVETTPEPEPEPVVTNYEMVIYRGDQSEVFSFEETVVAPAETESVNTSPAPAQPAVSQPVRPTEQKTAQPVATKQAQPAEKKQAEPAEKKEAEAATPVFPDAENFDPGVKWSAEKEKKEQEQKKEQEVKPSSQDEMKSLLQKMLPKN